MTRCDACNNEGISVAQKDEFESLKQGSTNTAAIEHYYDDWAKEYDGDIRNWAYRAPEEAAAQLAPHLPNDPQILDAGCGTGLVAEALLERCGCSITGIDISQASLELAEQRGIYRDLQRCDLQQPPLPFTDDSFDAAVSIGVMTYIADPSTLLADLCRLVRSGGHILFTHRDDTWLEQGFNELMLDIETRDFWKILQISEPRAYLPGNEDFATNIKVIFALSRVC